MVQAKTLVRTLYLPRIQKIISPYPIFLGFNELKYVEVTGWGGGWQQQLGDGVAANRGCGSSQQGCGFSETLYISLNGGGGGVGGGDINQLDCGGILVGSCVRVSASSSMGRQRGLRKSILDLLKSGGVEMRCVVKKGKKKARSWYIHTMIK